MVQWRRFFTERRKRREVYSGNSSSDERKSGKDYERIDYQETLAKLKEQFHSDLDYRTRDLVVFDNHPATIIFFSSLVDKEVISRDIIQPLLQELSNEDTLTKSIPVEEVIITRGLYNASVQKVDEGKKLVDELLKGNTILLMEGSSTAIVIDTKKVDKRAIAQPETEQVIRGPRDGFIELLESNISLLRNRLPIPTFRAKSMEIGSLTKTTICLFYIDDIANPTLIKEVEERLEKIRIDRILDAGYIEQFIQDNPRSPFPQVKNTERPDVVVGNLLEGRVAIMVDGSPFALIVPSTFMMFYQSSEDYNERTYMMSFVRLTRIVAIFFSLVTPSTYVAVISYHPELIPTAFSVAITSGRAGVPFPAVVEVFVMEAAMEILREATVRMPKQVGGALSIVGVLVVGQAAVMAGFVSPITVVVIAITTIASFSTPAYNLATGFRMLRFPLIFITSLLGLYGLVLGLIVIVNHLISLRSFGVPYFSPISPMNWGGMKDVVLRAPLGWLKDRPEELYVSNKKRVNSPVDVPKSNPLGPENQQGEGN